jgi:lipoprotein-anchoring transpeptidase ErfK/SrfK
MTTSIPEVGMLTDQGTARRGIVVRLSDQRAFLYKDGELVGVSPASTGREGYNTPTGKYRVIGKDIDHRSSLYGEYERDGRVIKRGIDVRKDPKPPGAVFVGAPMPYYLKIAPSYGLHAGHVPGYPASHGCIRLPSRWAKRFYYAVKVGTPVWISR